MYIDVKFTAKNDTSKDISEHILIVGRSFPSLCSPEIFHEFSKERSKKRVVFAPQFEK